MTPRLKLTFLPPKPQLFANRFGDTYIANMGCVELLDSELTEKLNQKKK